MDLLRGFDGLSERPKNVPKERIRSVRGNFPIGIANRSPSCPAIENMSIEKQERLLLKGVISVLGLTPDDLILSERTVAGDCKLHFHPSLNSQLVSEAKEFTDMAVNHSVIRAFITEYESTQFSLTLQSLVYCMTQIIGRFRLHLVGVSDKSEKLTLKLLKQQMAQQRVILLTLADLCRTITKERLEGAQILTLLYNWAGQSGHSVVRDLYEKCLKEAIKPYRKMLELWLKGERVIDQRGEFMIQAQPEYLQDNSIYSKYHVIAHNVPRFLEDLTKDILKAGCNAEMIRSIEEEFAEKDNTETSVNNHLGASYDTDLSVEDLRRGVQAVVSESSATLFQVMNKFGDLKEHLTSLKEVFLFVRADVFKRFCDMSRGQLIQIHSLCSPMVLRNFIADAVTESAASAFTQAHIGLKFHEDTLISRLANFAIRDGKIKEEDVNRNLQSAEHGYTFECLSTDLHGGWILQHLLTPDVREMYEIIFGVRLQLFLGESFCADLIPHASHMARAVLQRMLVFMQSLSSYFSLFSVEQEWTRLQKKLNQVRTVDSLSKTHRDYVWRIFQRCLLPNFEASSRLLSIASTVVQAAICFDRIINKDQTVIQPPASRGSDFAIDVERELGVPEFTEMVERDLSEVVEYFETQYNTAVARWLDIPEIKTHEQLLTLLAMNECYVVRKETSSL